MTKKERNRLIRARYEEGYSQAEIGKFYGLSQSAVSLILNSTEEEEEKKEGRRGAKSKLSTLQMDELKKELESPPDEGQGFRYWNKWSVQALIKDKFGVEYHHNYIYVLMKQIGHTSQLPQKKDYRQDPEKVRKYKEQKVIEITQKAEEEGRLLSFQDESAVRLLPSISRSYSPKGVSPEIKCDEKNKKYVSISGVISVTGKLYYEVREEEGFKQKGLTRFLSNCRKAMRKNLLLIWDNAPAHKSKEIKMYLAEQDEEDPAIWMENIPPYSPELNPIEQLWAYVKKELANQFFKTTKALKQAVIDTLEVIKNNKEIIISFFQHEKLSCYQFST